MNSDDEIFAQDVLGDDYEPPLTEDELNGARGIFHAAIIGYVCWALVLWYWFGG